MSKTASATAAAKKTSILNSSHGVPATPSTSSKSRTLATPSSHAPTPAPTPVSHHHNHHQQQHSHVMPPPAPVAVVSQYHDAENLPPANTGRDSEGTMYTSMTEIKDRSSNGSATVVRETN
jgi:hypothetical protein